MWLPLRSGTRARSGRCNGRSATADAGCEAVASATDLEGETPRAVGAVGANQAGAGPNHRPAFCCIDGIEDHESTVVDLVTAPCEGGAGAARRPLRG